MNEDNKLKAELLLKKIDKIKAFKEKVLRVKEEEFKNNIKVIKEKRENSKNHNSNNEKNYQRNKYKLYPSELSLSLESKKLMKEMKKSPRDEKNSIKLKPILFKENKEERKGRFLSKENYTFSNKNIKTSRTVQLKPIQKISIESKLSPIISQKNENNIIKEIVSNELNKENLENKTNNKENKEIKENKENEKNNENKEIKENKENQNKKENKEIKENKENQNNKENKEIKENKENKNNKENTEIKENKENQKNKENNYNTITNKENIINNSIKEELSNKDKLNEIEKKENEKILGIGLLKCSSKPNGLSLSLKSISNKKIIEEESKKEEAKKIKEIINMQKITSNSASPVNRHSSSNNDNNKPKFKKKEKKEYKLQYCVYPGNNTPLIDAVMEHRKQDWEKVPLTYSGFCDLTWSPLSCSINFQECEKKHQYANHIEFNNEISNKMRLYANLLRHCENKKIDIFEIFPFTITLQISHRSFNEQLKSFEKLYKNINNYTPKGNKKFSEMFNVILSKKIGSIQTINIPETFNDGKNLWIIKPVNLNRGRFISVEKNLKDIIKKAEEIQNKKKINVDDKKKGNDIKCEYLILQKYLEKPLLYQGRKFDIRIWVLFISCQEEDVYIFKQGHLKATCTQYDPDSNDLYVHLTNYSVQKYNENFSKIEIGNEIPFSSFQNELDKNNTGKNFYKDIYPKITRIVRITGGAAKGKINFLSKRYCFEIFGYDFILDNNFQPYLLEINTNPGLEISSPLISILLPRMVDDALKLTIDKEFTKSYKYANKESTFPVEGYENNENMWEKFSII